MFLNQYLMGTDYFHEFYNLTVTGKVVRVRVRMDEMILCSFGSRMLYSTFFFSRPNLSQIS